jgi:hypothetical protein
LPATSAACASEKFDRQRERMRSQAEKGETREIRNTQRLLLRETKPLQKHSTRKLRAAMMGIA